MLTHYSITNAAAWTLSGRERATAAVGAVGCIVVGLALPQSSVVGGVIVLVAGTTIWFARSALT